jgi:hypothetical protein
MSSMTVTLVSCHYSEIFKGLTSHVILSPRFLPDGGVISNSFHKQEALSIQYRSREEYTTNFYTEALCFAIYFATIVSMSEEEVSIVQHHDY